jgi:hypothetical protein
MFNSATFKGTQTVQQTCSSVAVMQGVLQTAQHILPAVGIGFLLWGHVQLAKIILRCRVGQGLEAEKEVARLAQLALKSVSDATAVCGADVHGNVTQCEAIRMWANTTVQLCTNKRSEDLLSLDPAFFSDTVDGFLRDVVDLCSRSGGIKFQYNSIDMQVPSPYGVSNCQQ